MRKFGNHVTALLHFTAVILACVASILFSSKLSFLSLGIIGGVIWFISVRLELEQGGAVGGQHTTSLYAQQIAAQNNMGKSEKASLRHHQSSFANSLEFLRTFGVTLTFIGFGVFSFTEIWPRL